MIIRYLTQDDVAAHDRVASQAFVFSCEIGDPASVLPCEKVLGAFADDNQTLYADLEIYDRTCHYDGSLLTCAAVGGVAAKPEHRGKGAVKALFNAVCSEDKYDVSILYPFSEAYYRKLGYERAGCALSATVPFAELSKTARNQDAVLYEGKDPARLLGVYNRCAEQYNLCFVRETTAAFSDKPYLTQNYTYVWKDRSFATFSIDRGKSTIFVKEMYYDSCEAMCGIIGFLRNFEANQNKVCFQNLPENTPLLRWIGDMKNCEISLHRTGAVKLLHPEKVLKAHKYPGPDGSFTIQIGGDVFQVTHTADGTDVEKNGGHAPDAVMAPGRAAQLLTCGFTNPADIPDLTVLNSASDFFRQFPPRTTFFSDDL